jgi:hypothetical protein
MDQRIKNGSVHDWLGKRVVDQNRVDYEEEEDYDKGDEYVWQEGQWCQEV